MLSLKIKIRVIRVPFFSVAYCLFGQPSWVSYCQHLDDFRLGGDAQDFLAVGLSEMAYPTSTQPLRYSCERHVIQRYRTVHRGGWDIAKHRPAIRADRCDYRRRLRQPGLLRCLGQLDPGGLVLHDDKLPVLQIIG